MSIKSFINSLGNKVQEVMPTGKIRSAENKVFEDMTQLRFGMWVMTPNGVGIVVNTNWAADATIYVDLTDSAGVTFQNYVPYPLTSLRQASYGQIPSPRRPDRESAARMGYR